jgi:hypothetical protein
MVVHPEDELSIPIIVPDPAMTRPRTPTDPPRMTVQEMARTMTLDRQRIERDMALLAKKVDGIGERIADLQLADKEHTVYISTLRESHGEFETLAEFREDIYTKVIDIAGKDGINGKLGALKARVDVAEARKWQVLMFCLGLLVTAGGVVAWASSNVADFKGRINRAEDDILELRRNRRGIMHGAPQPDAKETP